MSQGQNVAKTAPSVLATEPGAAVATSARGAAHWLLVCLGAAVLAAAYYPGVMRPDSLDQYREAISGRYTDWHPPVMAWLWGWIDAGGGPRSIFLLHLLLYAAGIGLIADGLRGGGRRLSAVLVLLAGAAPIPLGYVGVIMKDTTLMVSLLSAVGLVGRWALREEQVPATAWLGAGLLLAFGALLRFNAPFAAVPLLLCLLPRWRRARPLRRAALGVLALLLVLLASPIVTQAAFQPVRSDVRLSPIIYDLGGITHHSGRNHFPELGVAEFVRANSERCYSPTWWDNYYWGPCAFVFSRMGALMREGDFNPYLAWFQAVRAEPLAYLHHRLSHVNSNLRFLLPYGTSDVTFTESVPGEFGFAFTPNAVTAAIRTSGLLEASTPAGWPAAWLALSLGWLILLPALRPGPVRVMVSALALSALCYGASYLAVSVASDLRYHLWTMMAAALASAAGIGELLRLGRLPILRITLATAPVLVVSVLGMAWRVFDLPAP